MGLLFIGVVAGILIGFGFFAPSQSYFLGCGSQPCFDRMAVAHPAPTKPAALGPDPLIARVRPATPPGPDKKLSEKKRSIVHLAKAAPPTTRINVSPSSSATEVSDPVSNKARISVAAKLGDPNSAEFGEMKRATRKNTFGRPVDTICGRVKGRDASGGEAREMSFLYLVKDDDAYVVDGPTNSASAIAYRNICN
ncbi:hypothetical protein [Bradyrhizobium iriomotense]|uniref:Uncharacterized protein n=1 Tax=Bradyrhizobium iriomotense TaxID=441950 RepID=A0ABQ6AUM7_9BRAD|nr:hypothetical protein [Bradyrhizobium iriomotense]GLR85700.1 hypothetical protein GCM10007857_24110 [Bradyrhizobium iriomotense]